MKFMPVAMLVLSAGVVLHPSPWGALAAVAFAAYLAFDRFADAIAATSKLSETSDAMNRQAAAAQAMLAESTTLHASVTKHLADIAAMVDRHGLSRR